MLKKLQNREARFHASETAPCLLQIVGDYCIISHKKFKGVRVEGAIGLLPIYDDVVLNSKFNIGAVIVDRKAALADLHSGELLTNFEYDKISFEIDNHSIILYKGEKKCIYDVVKKEMIFDDFSDSIGIGRGNRYSWSYSQSRGYTIIDHVTNKTHSLGTSIEECFDETNGHMFVIREGRVTMLDDEGYTDSLAYRKLLASIGGRLNLHNSAHNVFVVADIYGRPI